MVHLNDDFVRRSAAAPSPPPRDDGWLLDLVQELGTIVFEAEAGTDTDPLRFTFVSPHAEELLGYPVQRWLEEPGFWLDHVHPADRDRASLARRSWTDGDGDAGQMDGEYRMLAQDGRTVWIRSLVRRLPAGPGLPPRIRGLLVDVTERRATSDALRESEERSRRLSDAMGDVTARGEAEEQLKEAEERFRTLVEQLPASVFVSAAEEGSRVLYMSPYHEVLTGYPVDRYVQDPYFWRETIHPADRDRIVGEARRTDASGEPFLEEYRLVRPDGTIAWVHEHTVLVTGDDGRPRWWQGVMLDITARKEAEQELREAEAKYRILLEQLPAAVFTMPPEDGTQVTYMSQGNRAITGYVQEDFERNPNLWQERIHPEDRRWVMERAEATDRTGEPFRAEYRMIAKDGRVVWTREESVLVRDGEGTPLFWQGVSFDITELKRAERELERALEREQEASRRLRLLDEMKTTFLEAVSHDLRTPLTAILGMALTLRNPDIELAPAEADDLMGRLIDNAKKLDRLLSDLLDLDRLSRGIVGPKRRPMDVTAAVRATVAQALDLLGDHPVHAEGTAPVMGVLDGAKFERILENLLVNASRHTPAGTPIWVRVERLPDGVLLVVEDSGPGVPDEMRPFIFDPFRQGSGSQGVGIGLSLVARFAELHGGRAWVEERDGGGASFRVLLRDA